MSSTRHSILGSTVFQRVLVASALFVAISLTAVWAFTLVMLTSLKTAQTERIEDTVGYAVDLYAEGGADAVIEMVAIDEGRLWPDDEIYWVLEEEQQILTFRDAAFEAVAGYPDLWADEDIARFPVVHPQLEGDVRGRAVYFEAGDSLTVAEFVPQAHHDLYGFALFATYALILIVLPLALITGFFLSRSVFNRIEGVSQTAAAVALGEMTRRAPVSARLDEFDRLSLGINQMLDRVDTLNSNIEAVSVGVAHDLKTPLANLGGRLELIRRDMAHPDAVEDHLTTAEGYLDQVLRIFDAILRLGEVEAGGRRSAFEAVDLTQMVTDMAEAYAPVFEDANKTFEFTIGAGAHIHGDAGLLQQMISNLLENALEHSRDAAHVALRLVTDGPPVLQIEDDGPGIAGPDQHRIFDRFYRADSSRTKPGNGLGLSLVKAIADLHGAQVSLDPLAKGAAFSITFNTDPAPHSQTLQDRMKAEADM